MIIRKLGVGLTGNLYREGIKYINVVGMACHHTTEGMLGLLGQRQKHKQTLIIVQLYITVKIITTCITIPC